MKFFTQNPNKSNWNAKQNDKYACLVVFHVLSYLCIASLLVVFGYIFINLNQQNRKLDSDIKEMRDEYERKNVQLQNLNNELQSCGNIKITQKAENLGLSKATMSQIYILECPDAFKNVLGIEYAQEKSQVAGR